MLHVKSDLADKSPVRLCAGSAGFQDLQGRLSTGRVSCPPYDSVASFPQLPLKSPLPDLITGLLSHWPDRKASSHP